MDDDTTQRDSHLLSICAALGGYEESERFVEGVGLVEGRYYVMGDETLACLRDLKKLLRNDQSSKEKTVLRALGRWNILQTDLIPILLAAKATGQEKISQTVVQLFVPLTWPVDPESIDAAGQQEIQRGYKEAFLQEGVLQAIMDQLLKPFAKIYRERTDRDHTFVALILTLFRNLLAIRDDQADITSTVEKYRRSTLQEDLIIHLEKADIVALLLSLAGSVDDREYVEYNMIIMEIFYYFFLERDPEHLVSAAKSRSTELAALRAEEQRLKQQARKAATRHSRFGGTLSFKLTDGQTFTVHNPTAAYNSVEEALDKNKGAQREVRNKVGQNEMKKARAVRSSEAARIYSETASAFLANCFNCMVESIRRDFAAERDKVQEHHYARFLWLCSFFLKFQLACLREYHRKGEVNREAGLAPPETSEMDFDTVTEFLDLRGLEFVCGRINRAKDEKRWPEVYVGIDCLKQILLSLDAMMLSADEELREASETIQKNMYYDHSTIELAFSLVTSFKRNHHLSHLKTLVELVHVLLKMLEYYSQQNATMLRRKTVKKKKRPGPSGPQARAEGDESEDGEPDVQNEAAEEAIRESKVTFNHIVARFATDGTVSTYCVLLKHYREVETQYIYFITVMFHRLFFKGGAGAPLFYKLSVLHLFNKILADKRVLPVCKAFSELYAFITYATGKFFKKAEEYPMLFLEVLYTKTKGDCMRIEFGNEDPVLPSKEDEDTGVVKDIEVKPGLTWGEEVQVAVTLLVEKDERELVTWITDILLDAATLRSPRPPTDGVAMDEEVVVSEAYDIKHETEEQGVALQRNVALRLLLRLLSFEEVTDEGPSIFYRIPPIITSTYLLGHRETIIRYLETPNVEDVSDMVRKKPKKRKRKAAASAGTRKAKEVKQFKSKQFVSDSDDDDDAEFYARERALKEKYDAIYKMMMEGGPDAAATTTTAGSKGKSMSKPTTAQNSGSGTSTPISVSDVESVSGSGSGSESEEDSRPPPSNRISPVLETGRPKPRVTASPIVKRALTGRRHVLESDEDDDEGLGGNDSGNDNPGVGSGAPTIAAAAEPSTVATPQGQRAFGGVLDNTLQALDNALSGPVTTGGEVDFEELLMSPATKRRRREEKGSGGVGGKGGVENGYDVGIGSEGKGSDEGDRVENLGDAEEERAVKGTVKRRRVFQDSDSEAEETQGC